MKHNHHINCINICIGIGIILNRELYLTSGINAWLSSITPAVKFQSWKPICLQVHCQTYILPFVHSFQSCLLIASLPYALPSCHMRYFLDVSIVFSDSLETTILWRDCSLRWRIMVYTCWSVKRPLHATCIDLSALEESWGLLCKNVENLLKFEGSFLLERVKNIKSVVWMEVNLFVDWKI